MKIVVASENPVKIEAVRVGFSEMFPTEALEVVGAAAASGVSAQPITDDETRLGAENRAEAVRMRHPEADFWVGIEGGLHPAGETYEVFAWVVIASRFHKGIAKTGMFFLPPALAELVRQGKELGEADDIVFGKVNSKQETGAIGILTNDRITRQSYYTAAVIMALIPFKNAELYCAF